GAILLILLSLMNKYLRFGKPLTVNVLASIASFQARPVTIPQNGSFTPPVAYPHLSDGTYYMSEYSVTWNTAALDTTKPGVYNLEGTVAGFDQKAYLTVTVVPQFTIDNIRASVKQGDTYALPQTVTAKVYDGTVREVPVVWNTASVDTSVGGTQTFEGTVEGYDGKVILTLFVEGTGLVYFSDPKLESAVRKALSKPTGDILKSDMLNLRSLDAKYLDIVSLEGLQYAENLDTLYLTSNEIEDISQLSGLPNLRYLFINDNKIKSIAPLAYVPKLSLLSIGMNQITDISPLKGLTNLKSIDFNRNALNDVSCLKDFKSNLDSLNLYSCKIQDISSVSLFKNLTTLSLGYNNIRDISALSSLTNLQYLDLEDNAVEDMSPLSNLTKLTKLYLSGNCIKDYSGYVAFNDSIKVDFWGFTQTKAEVAAFLNTVDQIIASVVTPDMTPLQKEKALHDYICTNTTYTLGVYTGAYGVLIDKKGACDAISDTMNILLNRAGVECIKVAHGWAGGAHAWNIVKIDGRYYHLDCTWDTVYTAKDGTLSCTYFNVNDSFMKAEGRTWDTVKYPACV
ncbi:MAG TPA: leucine-rich repeat domain-containing protein, partial [Ruminiclostridium sp.]|nr:leucine-rich repeat domain-containing protein [Ruminiclostridium sp.]